MISRTEALERLKAQNPDAQLLNHSLQTEAIMRVLAEHFKENVEEWGICGLLHDIDFSTTKHNVEEHGLKAERELLGGVDPQYVHAIVAHNHEHSGRNPEYVLDYAVRSAESITGLISAAALMRPTGMEGMAVKSIKKKMKDKAFAANVSRERIQECEKMNIPLDDFIALSIKALS